MEKSLKEHSETKMTSSVFRENMDKYEKKPNCRFSSVKNALKLFKTMEQ